MGENGARLGRTLGYSRRGWLAALTGGGAAAIALVMMLSPAASAAAGSVTLHPAWHGAVSPSNDLYSSGCTATKVTKPMAFHLKTGIGTYASNGKVNQCKHVVNGVGATSYADVSAGLTISIPIKAGIITGTSSSVQLNTALTASVLLKATDGVASNLNPPPICTGAKTSYHDMFFDYGWNYSLSQYGYYTFANYNYTDAYWDNYSGGSYSYSYSYGNAAIPSPFNLNSTSYEDLYNFWGASASCFATSEFFLDMNNYLIDANTGSYMTETSENHANYADSYISVYTQVSWSCGYDFYWYGPTNYTFGNTTVTCTSYNTTLTSEVSSFTETFYPSFTYVSSYTTGTNNTQTWSMTGTTNMADWWNDTFATHDHYYLMVEMSIGAYGEDSWKKGFGQWNINAGTLGNGFKLQSLVVS